jgi:nicotinamidase/pyrazinamidase
MPGLMFWDVDTQDDFMLPDGKLYVPGAESLRSSLEAFTRFAHARAIPIVASADDHDLTDPEISSTPDWATTFPPHCIRGTLGQRKIAETMLRDPLVLQPIKQDPAALARRISDHRGDFLLLKHELDVFSNPNTGVVVDSLAPEAIVLYGVATDFCDRLTIEGLLRGGTATRLFFVTDAARAIDAARGEALIQDWARRGVRPITTRDVIGGTGLERWL